MKNQFDCFKFNANFNGLSLLRFFLILLAFQTLSPAAHAGNFVVFGPSDFAGKTVNTKTISVLNPSAAYKLHIDNGGSNNQFARVVSSGLVKLNGDEIVSPSEFNQNVKVIEKSITLLANNTMTIDLSSNADSGITLQVIGNDTDKPNITATVTPAANNAGWHKTDAVVSFVCTDSTTKITACTSPINITSQGAGQIVEGTAQDEGGNTAATNVTISLDNTPPTITPSVQPPANAAGWHNADATVSFNCTDNLSGIIACTSPISVNAEEAGQNMQGKAEDRAGNTATATAAVKLDKTPPSVTITSPIDGAVLTGNTVHVEGAINETLSGVAAVKCNGEPAAAGLTFSCDVPLHPGANTLSVQAVDAAGNSASSSIGVTLSQAAIDIIEPANLSFFNISPVIVSGTVAPGTSGVTVNGIAASLDSGHWSASIPLQEGNNTLTAVAKNINGGMETASIQATLDTTPPRVTVDAPVNGFKTTADKITVTGIVNDIVVGTVNSGQAGVTVNGVAAQVANRTYIAPDIPLQLGQNTIQVIGKDQVGNSATTSIQVTRESVAGPFIKQLSGNNQSGSIGAPLSQPLVVQLLDGSTPVPNVPVIFKVTENDGFLTLMNGKKLQLIAANTNAEGRAGVTLALGNRAGAGNNVVEAYAVGYQGTALFSASGTPTPAAHINVDSGTNQFGAVNNALPLPFVAVVTDAGHNRLGGVPVTFNVTQGGGNINGKTTLETTSDSDGRVLAVLTLGPEAGQDNNVVEATFQGNTGFAAAFAASGKIPSDPLQTAITGVVQDNSNNPIPGVTLRLYTTHQLINSNGVNNNQPQEVVAPVVTDTGGHFRIKPAPVGFFKLMADGATATTTGKKYPTLEYDIVTVAGQDNGVGLPVYLPALDPDAKLCVDAQTGGTLKMASSPGFSLTIAPGAATFPGSSKTGCVSVTPVNPDKVPMVPGFGQQPRYVVTIQPVGTTFNPPAAITIPNLDGLAPHAKTEMYSYDHDLAAFVAIGSGTVSADGSVIASDPGIGVIKAGWHCGGNPNSTGSAGTCPTCRKCQGSDCVSDPAKDGNSCLINDVNGLCTNGDCQIPGIEITAPDTSTNLVITAEPQMPQFPTAQAKITGVTPDPTSSTNFNWQVEVTHNSSNCPNGTGRQTSMAPILGSAIGGSFAPQFTEIRGSDLTLTVNATIAGQNLQKSKSGFTIKGTNPNKSDIQASLLHNTLRRIACHESRQRQFNAASNGGTSECPLWSGDGLNGVGIFQLTNPAPTIDQIWNWRRNVASGISVFNAKLINASGYPNNVRGNSVSFQQAVADFNEQRVTQGLPALTVTVPDWTSTGFDAASLGQLELDTIRGFNGYGTNHGHYTNLLHEFDIQQDANGDLVINQIEGSNQGSVVWYQVPGTVAARGSSGDPAYVSNVLSKDPTCP